MLIVIIGTDSEKRSKASGGIKEFLPATEVFNGDTESFLMHVNDESLFEERRVSMLVNGLTDKSSRDAIKDRVEDLKNSKHVFIIDDVTVPTNYVTGLLKSADMAFNCGASSVEREDVFTFTKAFIRRDKKQAFVELEKIDYEEEMGLHGALYWQVKSMCEGVGARGGAFTKDEAKELLFDMILALHYQVNGIQKMRFSLTELTLKWGR